MFLQAQQRVYIWRKAHLKCLFAVCVKWSRYSCAYMHIRPVYDSSPALPHSILLCGASIGHLLTVKHQGIFKTDLTGIIWLQPWGKQTHVSFIKNFWVQEASVFIYVGPLSAHLSQRRKTPPRCSYWAEKVTKRYSEAMFPPSACPCSPASLSKHHRQPNTLTCNTDSSLHRAGQLAVVVKAKYFLIHAVNKTITTVSSSVPPELLS